MGTEQDKPASAIRTRLDISIWAVSVGVPIRIRMHVKNIEFWPDVREQHKGVRLQNDNGQFRDLTCIPSLALNHI